MCPACIGSTLLLLSGAGSAGGVAAVTVGWIVRRRARLEPGDSATRSDMSNRQTEPGFASGADESGVTPSRHS